MKRNHCYAHKQFRGDCFLCLVSNIPEEEKQKLIWFEQVANRATSEQVMNTWRINAMRENRRILQELMEESINQFTKEKLAKIFKSIDELSKAFKKASEDLRIKL